MKIKMYLFRSAASFIRRGKRDLEARHRSQPDEERAKRPIYKKRTAPVKTKLRSVETKTEPSVARGGSETTSDAATVKVRKKQGKGFFLNLILYLSIKSRKFQTFYFFQGGD